MTPSSPLITRALPADDPQLADFYYQHWLAMGVAEHAIATDWRAQALAFIAQARLHHDFAGFLAHAAGQPVGGACCQRIARVYPAFLASDAEQIGYLWGVYVIPAARGQGLGARLVQACVQHLAALGCGRVLLHAAERARPLYTRLGFQATDELALQLAPPTP